MKSSYIVLLTVVLISDVAVAQNRPCANAFADCPKHGCAQSGTPEAAANKRQRVEMGKGPIITLTVADFEELQAVVDHVQPRGIAVPDRAILQDKEYLRRKAGAGYRVKAAEGDLVRFTGYIVGIPRGTRPDSGNCNFIGRDFNNWWISLGEVQGDTEFDSISAIMTPWVRKAHRGWELEKLRGIALKRRRVRVTGVLFYDSKHFVNADPDHEIAGEPKRLSVWEIRPVLGFESCREEEPRDCDDKDAKWESLDVAPLEDLR